MANGLTLVAENLFSRAVRSEIGTRVIESFELAQESSSAGGVVGALQYVWSGFTSLVGFIIQNIPGVANFAWSLFWTYVIQPVQYIWNFDWNATDSQLDANLKGQFTALAGSLGQATGQVFGYAACGITPGCLIFAFNEPMGAMVLEKVTEKFLESFLTQLGVILNQALSLAVQTALTETYKTVRKLIKAAANNPVIAGYLGTNITNAINAWGGTSANGVAPQHWSIGSAFQSGVDAIFGKEGASAQFGQQLVQQATQSCVEAGYVVANTVDTFLAQQTLAAQHSIALGTTRYVEVTPDRTVPSEKIVLAGTEETLKPAIIQTLSTNKQFNGRDLGTVYGELQGEIAERRYRPEVVLMFYRKQNKLASKGPIVSALSMRIGFRLMTKSIKDFATNTYLLQLAEAVYVEFGSSPFTITKGTETYTYSDFSNGFQFKLDVVNQAEALRVIERVLAIQEIPFNLLYFRKGSSPIEKPPTSGTSVELQGTLHMIPVNNQSGIVTFSHAYLNTGINLPPINLVDLTGKKKNVVFKPGQTNGLPSAPTTSV